MSIISWYEIEGLILAKSGIFSVFYHGLWPYGPFIIAFSVSLVAIDLLEKEQDPNLRQAIHINLKTIGLLIYSTVAVAYVGVGLYDVTVQLYVQWAIPQEDSMARLTFMLRAEHIAVENFIKYILFLLVPISLLLRSDRNLLSAIFTPAQRRFKGTLVVSLACGLAIGLSGYLNSMAFGVTSREELFTLAGLTTKLMGVSPLVGLGYVLVMIPLIAIGEEMIFRGIIYSGFREKIGIIPALVLGSALFAGYHGISWWLPYYFLAGIFLSLLYEQMRSIYPSIAVHASLLALSVFVGLL